MDDVYCINIPGDSTSTWQISPPSLSSLKSELERQNDLKLSLVHTLTRFDELTYFISILHL
jgi:hypothetical protein